MKISARKKNARKAFAFRKPVPCPRCGQDISGGGHFVSGLNVWICQDALHPGETEEQREVRIFNDVFNPAESDYEYFLRRGRELGVTE